MLNRRAGLLALLIPRVRAGWPAIGAIALAVVLAHSGIAHLDASAAVEAHYRAAVGDEGFGRIAGIAQLLAAGGLCFRRTRSMTALAFAAVVLIGIANQLRTDRAGIETLTSLALVAWAGAIAWGESRRASRYPQPQ